MNTASGVVWSEEELLLTASEYIDREEFEGAYSILFEILRKSPVSVSSFLLLAQIQLQVGNNQAALGHLKHVLEIDPENATAADAVQQIKDQARENIESREYSETESWRFSTLIVPVHRSGNRALVRFLSTHPEILVASVDEIDKALKEGSENGMLGKYQTLQANLAKKTSVIVKHMHIAGFNGPVEMAERCARITSGENFIQFVREPISAFQSNFDHAVFLQNCRYSFRSANLNWPHICELTTDMSDELPVLEFMDSTKTFGEFSRDGEIFPDELRSLRYFDVGCNYAKYFENWHLFDVSELGEDKVLSSISSILKTIKVNNNYDFSIFYIPQLNTIRRFMEHNGISIRINGMDTEVRLGFTGEALVWPDEDFVEVASATLPENFVFLDRNTSVSMLANAQAWHRVPRQTRVGLIETKRLESFFRDRLLPLWLQNYEYILRCLEPYLFDNESGLAEDLRLQYLKVNGDDVERLFERFPRLREVWGYGQLL